MQCFYRCPCSHFSVSPKTLLLPFTRLINCNKAKQTPTINTNSIINNTSNMNYYTKAIILLLAVASTAADNNQLLEDTSTKSITITADKILQVLKGESSLFGDTTSLVGVGVDSESTLERERDGNRDGGRGNRGGGGGDKGRGGGGNKGGGSRPNKPNDSRTRRPRPPFPRPPRPTRRPTRRPPTPRVSCVYFSILFDSFTTLASSSSLTYVHYFL